MTQQLTRPDRRLRQGFDPCRERLWIGGRWTTPAAGPSTRPVVDPADNTVFGRVPVGSSDDVDLAVAAAAAAFQDWSTRSPAERGRFLTALAAAMRGRQQEFAEVISAEMGAPLDNADAVQTGLAIDVVASYPDILADFEWDRSVGRSIVTHEPIGVVAAITPWNYPLYLIVLKLAPALAAGCTVIVKPSDEAPLDAFLLAEVFQQVCAETGAPVGIFNVVTGPGKVVGERLAAHPGVDAVSFTGSTEVGRRVAALATGTVKRVGLELGGKSAAVILDDVADLEAVLATALGNVFYNSGQTCTACTRILLPRGRYDEAIEIARRVAGAFSLGDPRRRGAHLGPIATRRQYESVRAHIESGLAAGARLVTGGVAAAEQSPALLEAGNWVLPTVFADVPPDAEIAREEIFGPVAVLVPYDSEDDAVALANDSDYGLAGAVHSGDPERAMRVARRLRTGRVDINGAPFNVLAPAGGYKQSGNGRELGVFGLLEYLEIKSIQR